LDLLFGAVNIFSRREPSKTVAGWLAHMQEWTDSWGGIPALVLHWPGTWVANATFVVFINDKEKMNGRHCFNYL
jgi:hypothetical protein